MCINNFDIEYLYFRYYTSFQKNLEGQCLNKNRLTGSLFILLDKIISTLLAESTKDVYSNNGGCAGWNYLHDCLVYQQNIAQSVPPYFDILVSLVMIIWIVEKSYYMKRIFMRWVNFTSTNYSLFWFCYILREWGPKKMQEEKFH